MIKKNKLIFSLSIVSLLVSGCAMKSPTNISNIENNKQENLKKEIHISNASGYKAYIDDNNNLQYLCSHGNQYKCNYYDYKKHSHTNGKPDEETFWINSSGYYPSISPSTAGVQCGKGSLFGWLAIFMMKPFGIEDYDKKNFEVCHNKFTELDSTQIGERVIFGLLTFMTPLVTGGNMHTEKFDEDAFKDSVYISNIESFKSELLSITQQYNIHSGLDIFYISSDDTEDDLEDKYNALLEDKSKKDGVIFLEKDTNKLLSINIFQKYKNKDLINSISAQINDLLSDISKNNQYELKYSDIVPYIPEKIALPQIPKVPDVQKDEFETKANFQKRIKQLVKQREEKIRAIQRKYSLDVFQRNSYIYNLQKSYKIYLEHKAEEKNSLLQNLKSNIPLLSKALFLENISGYTADSFKYNAEEQKLYFKISSKERGFEQEVVASIPAKTAKAIKISQTFKIIPNITFTNNIMKLKGFEIVETTSNDSFITHYTNINYTPEEVKVTVRGVTESIKEEISDHFKQYEQKNTPIIDNSKHEIWYIDIASRINAKVPKWFSRPKNGSKIIGYGEGKTLNIAKANAREDLSNMVKVKINTLLETRTNVNNFKTFSEVKNQVKQSSNIVLFANEYKLFRQDRIDGEWYVGLEYLK